MFCEKCGKQLEEGAVFCDNCGTAVQQEQQPEQNNTSSQNGFVNNIQNFAENVVTEAKTQDRKKLIISAAIILVAIVLVIVLAVNIFGGQSAESAAKKMVEAETSGDIQALEKYSFFTMDELFEADILNKDDILDSYDVENLSDAYEECKENFEDRIKNKYGDDYEIELEVKRVKELSGSKEEDALDTLEDMLSNDRFEDLDFNIDDVSKVCEVKVRARIEGEDDKDKEDDTLTLYKYKGKWCYLRALYNLINFGYGE